MSMRCNRILFDKISAQFRILTMKAAYVLAEHQLNDEAQRQMEKRVETPEDQWMYDAFGNPKDLKQPKSEIELIDEQLTEIERQGGRLLENEEYEKLAIMKEVYDKLIKRWQQLNR